ncbi:MAG: DUF134 domain-containing protein [Bacillota bacterium]|nr:DUF134 domain-containing protein [Bacillota bacterium]
MPRPKRRRKICALPRISEFLPSGGAPGFITLTVEEYESIRLIDQQGLSQEKCAACMQVARTTAQQIYNSARKKLALALVNGLGLRIEGGDYRLCDGGEQLCGCSPCSRHCAEEQ